MSETGETSPEKDTPGRADNGLPFPEGERAVAAYYVKGVVILLVAAAVTAIGWHLKIPPMRPYVLETFGMLYVGLYLSWRPVRMGNGLPFGEALVKTPMVAVPTMMGAIFMIMVSGVSMLVQSIR